MGPLRHAGRDTHARQGAMGHHITAWPSRSQCRSNAACATCDHNHTLACHMHTHTMAARSPGPTSVQKNCGSSHSTKLTQPEATALSNDNRDECTPVACCAHSISSRFPDNATLLRKSARRITASGLLHYQQPSNAHTVLAFSYVTIQAVWPHGSFVLVPTQGSR